ncbi:hypothetical protein [Natrarchaeobius oligotrophus]|uniref:hypothetical protein n=1 Tax=Natrarchaeobius oligotrophus TaxID=3455743 RepID=UPI000F5424A6|nr:hypothetical protein [Natrarchaeobius chitinivorans]
MESNIPSITRRKVLKTTSASVLTTAGFVGSANASSSGRYEGYLYDPTTFEILEEVTAQSNAEKDTFVGNIRIGDRIINMSAKSPVKTFEDAGGITRVFRDVDPRDEDRGETYDRLVKLQDTGDYWFSGTV